MNISRFFPYKCIKNQIWPCHKVGQGQARFIICRDHIPNATYDTKPQGRWPFVPENKIFKGFKGFLPYMGVVALTFETYL